MPIGRPRMRAWEAAYTTRQSGGRPSAPVTDRKGRHVRRPAPPGSANRPTQDDDVPANATVRIEAPDYEALGLDKDWSARALRAVGNYGEIFARNVGADSPLQLPRGLNAPWNKGGLLYAPPLR
mgnify:CR=1 FL=1